MAIHDNLKVLKLTNTPRLVGHLRGRAMGDNLRIFPYFYSSGIHEVDNYQMLPDT